MSHSISNIFPILDSYIINYIFCLHISDYESLNDT